MSAEKRVRYYQINKDSKKIILILLV